MLTKTIGVLFILACPWMAGFFLVAGVCYLFDIKDIETITEYFAFESIIWLALFMGWFDGSKYQKLL